MDLQRITSEGIAEAAQNMLKFFDVNKIVSVHELNIFAGKVYQLPESFAHIEFL